MGIFKLPRLFRWRQMATKRCLDHIWRVNRNSIWGKSEHLEKKEKWTFEGESFEESLLIFGRMLADEVRRSGLRAYLPRGYILVRSKGQSIAVAKRKAY